MPHETARTARTLPVAERKARLQKLVAEGKVTAKQAAMVDFREPTEQERRYAKTLVPLARRALARNGRAAA